MLLSTWRRLLPELLFSHLFKPVVKEFWDGICLGCWNRREETLGKSWNFLEYWKVVIHGSEELLHRCCPGEAYCSSYCVFRSVQGSYEGGFL